MNPNTNQTTELLSAVPTFQDQIAPSRAHKLRDTRTQHPETRTETPLLSLSAHQTGRATLTTTTVLETVQHDPTAFHTLIINPGTDNLVSKKPLSSRDYELD